NEASTSANASPHSSSGSRIHPRRRRHASPRPGSSLVVSQPLERQPRAVATAVPLGQDHHQHPRRFGRRPPGKPAELGVPLRSETKLRHPRMLPRTAPLGAASTRDGGATPLLDQAHRSSFRSHSSASRALSRPLCPSAKTTTNTRGDSAGAHPANQPSSVSP